MYEESESHERESKGEVLDPCRLLVTLALHLPTGVKISAGQQTSREETKKKKTRA
jgi:hypothetical protein